MGLKNMKSLYDRNSIQTQSELDADSTTVGTSLPSDGDYFRSEGITTSPFKLDGSANPMPIELKKDHLLELMKDKTVVGQFGTYDPTLMAGSSTLTSTGGDSLSRFFDDQDYDGADLSTSGYVNNQPD